MPSRPLHPDTALSIAIGCVMSRNKYTKDPGPVIEELYATAEGRIDLLAHKVGMFIGGQLPAEVDACKPLTDALRALDLDTAEGERLVRERLAAPLYSTRGFNGPHGH